jgi:hypothetical protein
VRLWWSVKKPPYAALHAMRNLIIGQRFINPFIAHFSTTPHLIILKKIVANDQILCVHILWSENLILSL